MLVFVNIAVVNLRVIGEVWKAVEGEYEEEKEGDSEA